MRLMKGSWARPLLALASAVVAVLIVFGGIAGSRTPEVRAQETPAFPAIPENICVLDYVWNVCVVKVTEPGGTGDLFDFRLTLGPDVYIFNLEDFEFDHTGFTGTDIDQNGNVLTITETGMPPGWELVDIQCILLGTDPSINLDYDVENGSVEIELESGPGLVVCAFYNEFDEDLVPSPTPPGGERRPPNIGTGLSGLFGSGPAPATPTVVAPAAAPAPSRVISPPNTGDGGLR